MDTKSISLFYQELTTCVVLREHAFVFRTASSVYQFMHEKYLLLKGTTSLICLLCRVCFLILHHPTTGKKFSNMKRITSLLQNAILCKKDPYMFSKRRTSLNKHCR